QRWTMSSGAMATSLYYRTPSPAERQGMCRDCSSCTAQSAFLTAYDFLVSRLVCCRFLTERCWTMSFSVRGHSAASGSLVWATLGPILIWFNGWLEIGGKSLVLFA